MINKILKILIPFILIGIIISIGYNAYIKTQKNEINPIEVIPNNASIIIQLNNVKNLSRYLKKSTIWSKLKSIDNLERKIIILSKQNSKISNIVSDVIIKLKRAIVYVTTLNDNLNLSKKGFSISKSFGIGSYNFTNPNKSSLTILGIQRRGKDIQETAAMIALGYILFDILKLFFLLIKFIIWFLFRYVIIWILDQILKLFIFYTKLILIISI